MAATRCPDPDHMHGCYAEACARASRIRRALTPAGTTCRYPRCQAGGTILEGAPRFERVGLVTGVQLSSYHHGCWAAMQREGQ